MIHGHAKIELTDVNTHEVQVYEHDNYLTNWIRDMMTPVGGIFSWNIQRLQPKSEGGNPFQYKNTHFFGGVILFEDALDNDANNYKFPSNNKMIARGIFNKAYNGVDTTLGSYNSSLSSTDSDTQITLIWDFSLDKGNGTISSLGMTNLWGAYIGNGVSSPSLYDSAQRRRLDSLSNCLHDSTNYATSQSTLYGFYYNVANDTLNYMYYSGNSTKKLMFREFHSGFTTYKPLINKMYNINNSLNPTLQISSDTLAGTDEIDVSSFSGMNFSEDTFGSYQDQDAIYFSGQNSNWESGTDFTIYKLEFPSKTITPITITNNTGKTIYRRAGATQYFSKCVYAIHNGYFYGQTSDKKLVYINLSDNTEYGVVTDLNGNDLAITGLGSNDWCHYYCFNNYYGDLYFTLSESAPRSGGTGIWYKLFSKDKASTTCAGTASDNNVVIRTAPYNNAVELLAMEQNPGYIQLFINLNLTTLTTKCNLDSPITKTSSQTMRVTYTIQSDNS